MVFCRRKKSDLPEEQSRELLIASATRLFALKGFDGTTVRDIAADAKLNVSLVSYYFDGKEGLYRACLARFGREQLGVMERLLVPPTVSGSRGSEEMETKVRLAIGEFLQAQISRPEIFELVQREIDSQLPLARDIFEETFLKLFGLWVDFFSAGQKLGLLRPTVDPSVLVQLIHMSLTQMSRCDHIRKSFFAQSIYDANYRSHLIDQIVAIVLQGVAQPNSYSNAPLESSRSLP